MWDWLKSARESNHSVVAVVSLAFLTDALIYGIVIPILPDYASEKFDASPLMIGLLFGAYAFGLVIFTPIFGILSDRPEVGRRKPMLIGLAALAVTTIVYAIANQLWMLILARFAQGVSAAATGVVGLAMVADVHDIDELGSKMGIVMGINGLGILIGPPLGGVLYDEVSYLSSFLICASFAALDFICRIVFIDEDAIQDKIRKKREKRERENEKMKTDNEEEGNVNDNDLYNDDRIHDNNSATLAKGTTKMATRTATPDSSMTTLMLTPELGVTIVGLIIGASVLSGVEPVLPIFLHDAFQTTPTTNGLMFMAIIISYSLFSGVAGSLCPSPLGFKVVFLIGLFIMCISAPLLAFPSLSSVNIFYLEIIPLAGLGVGAAFTITPCLPEIADYLDRTGRHEASARGYALFNLAYSIGMCFGPLVAGGLYSSVSSFSSFSSMLLTGGAFSVACLLYMPIVAIQASRESKQSTAREEEKQKRFRLTVSEVNPTLTPTRTTAPNDSAQTTDYQLLDDTH